MSTHDFENRFLEGVAVHLADADVAQWRPSGVYGASETAIYIDAQPQSPDAILSLATYAVEDPIEPDSMMAVQILTRAAGADPRPVNDLAGKAFDALHGLSNTELAGGVKVQLCWRQSGSDLGQDGSRRWARSDNYYFRVYRPGPHRM